MKYKKNEWRQHFAFCKSYIFALNERSLTMELFSADLDDEIKHAKKNDEIEIVCRWRNIGDALRNPKNPNFKKLNKAYTHEINYKKKHGKK